MRTLASECNGPAASSSFTSLHFAGTAPSSGPTAPPSPDTEATVLPTAQVEENKKAAEARRVEREAARRAQMDAEAEDFIEADDDDDDEDEGEDGGDDDEDDEDEDEVDLD